MAHTVYCVCHFKYTFCILYIYLPTPVEEEPDSPEKPKPQYAIITANGREQNVVKRYFKLVPFHGVNATARDRRSLTC